MKKIIASILIALGLMVPTVTHAAKAVDPSGTIVLNETGSLQFGDTVTFTTTHDRLKGSQWPMIYVACRSVVDGTLLYGQLDHPEVGFLLGGASSPWWDQRDNALCQGYLYAYSKQGDIALLATTFTNFAVDGGV